MPDNAARESLQGKIALVTGAARGLGAAMANGLVEAGAHVVFVDLDGAQAAAQAAAAQAAARHGKAKTLGFTADVTRGSDCAAAVAAAVDAFGALHILVNNAGKGPVHVEASPHTKSLKFWEADPIVWQDVIVTNVCGAFLMAREAAPHMLQAKWGRIVNITTSLSTMQRKENSPYGVSKVAIEAETLIWAKDLQGTGVTVNSLIPGGAADTDFVSAPTRRSGKELIAPAVMVPPLLWLASSESDGVTGARFVGKNWDPALPTREAAQAAREEAVIRPSPDER